MFKRARRGSGRKTRYKTEQAEIKRCSKNNHEGNLIYIRGRPYCPVCNIAYDGDISFQPSKKRIRRIKLETSVQ